MGELKQRRGAKANQAEGTNAAAASAKGSTAYSQPSAAASASASASASAAASTSATAAAAPRRASPNPTPQPPKRQIGKAILLVVFYVPFIAVCNPITVSRLIVHLNRVECTGTCRIDPTQIDATCGPIDTTRLVYLRIPRTGAATVSSVFEHLGGTTKSVDRLTLDDRKVEGSSGLTTSLPASGRNAETVPGYHDPDRMATRRATQTVYKAVARLAVHPPHGGSERHFYDLPVHHIRDWTLMAKLLEPEPSWYKSLPSLVRELYGLDGGATDGDLRDVREITLMRNPEDRLASVYYHDRHAARRAEWRTDLVEARGNATLQECLLDADCVDRNELRRWCSLQTEVLCGTGKECERPVGRAALERALDNVRNKEVWFVGTTERMEDSLRVLERYFPTYLEGVGKMQLPSLLPREGGNHRVGGSRREKTFSVEAKEALDDICSLDNELYAHVDEILTEHMEACKIQ